MNKYLVTFGVGTKYAKQCLVLSALTELDARAYAFVRYGKDNIAFIRDYEQNKNLISKYGYKVIEKNV